MILDKMKIHLLYFHEPYTTSLFKVHPSLEFRSNNYSGRHCPIWWNSYVMLPKNISCPILGCLYINNAWISQQICGIINIYLINYYYLILLKLLLFKYFETVSLFTVIVIRDARFRKECKDLWWLWPLRQTPLHVIIFSSYFFLLLKLLFCVNVEKLIKLFLLNRTKIHISKWFSVQNKNISSLLSYRIQIYWETPYMNDSFRGFINTLDDFRYRFRL